MFTKTRLFSLTLLLAFILVAWLVWARDASPLARAQSSPLYSTLIAQNQDALNTMNARMTYYNLSGSIALTTTHTVAPYRSITLNQPSQPGLATSYAGAGLFESDRPFGLVISEYNGTVGALGANFRADSYIGATTPVTESVFPQLLKNVYDSGTALTFNSRLTLQNVNSAKTKLAGHYK
ncbi:MAG: hypothetical protein HZC40_09030 [Chloroflexi bacterium]|nr:hypothetical protein [Chloroflexota bacterium]